MNFTSGPPLWAWLPCQALLVFVGLWALSVAIGWQVVLIAGFLALVAIPVLATTFLLGENPRAAAIVLAILPAIIFARIAGVRLAVDPETFLSFFHHVTLWVMYAVAAWAAAVTVYLVQYRLDARWRTPLWGSARQEEILGSKPLPPAAVPSAS